MNPCRHEISPIPAISPLQAEGGGESLNQAMRRALAARSRLSGRGPLSRPRWELPRRLALASQARQFDPGPDTELGEDVAQVGVHRVRGDVKLLGYLTVGRALDD